MDERLALKNEAHLRIAKKLLKQTGMDFNYLLEALEEERTEDFKFSISIEEGNTKDMRPYVDSSLNQSIKIIKMELPDLPEGQQFMDSLNQLEYFDVYQSDTAGGDQVFHSFSVVQQLTSTSNEAKEAALDDSTFVRQLQVQFDEEHQQLNWNALWNILPQMVFAFFLFALSGLATFLVLRNFQERQRLLEGKNTFISNMTHELQTPVSTISVALEAIQDFNVKSEPEKADAYISASRKELKRLSNLIDQVLSFSKMDAGKTVYDFEAEDLGELLKEVLAQLDLAIQQRQAQCNFSFQLDTYPLLADAFQLKQAIHNLIDNSLKYGQEGVVIDVQIIEKEHFWELSVQDNGPGIAKKDQRKVFDRFYRVRQGQVHTVKGYGLGLSYVQEVVNAHGGKVVLKSQVGQGTTIILSLPINN